MKLIIQLVTWNGEKYIPHLFESLKKQTNQDWSLKILDNGSTDKTVEVLKKETGNWKLETGNNIELIESKENVGFAKGHNELSRKSKVESQKYLLLLNQDMVLEHDCIEKLTKFMDNNLDVAVVSPRLMKWDFDNQKFTNKIDSLGLKILRSRRVIEMYTGQHWEKVKGQLSVVSGHGLEVFGVSGAIPMFRKTAIDKIGLFDGYFNAYKEDVDLAFRLQSAGYKAYTILNAVAYHDRTGGGTKHADDFSTAKNKKKQNELVKYNSYKNHLMTLYKNEYWQNFILDLPWILWYELKKFIWFLLFDRSVLKGWKEIWRKKKDLENKRLEIKKLRKVRWMEIRKWINQ